MRIAVNIKIKICGITNLADAAGTVDAGADAIGLNFYRGSMRFVNIGDARTIANAVGRRAKIVGVFVDAPVDEIRSVGDEVALDFIQLHGNEPPEVLQQLEENCGIVRARRLDERGPRAIRDDLADCRRLCGFAPDAILIDAAAAGQFGGTGQTVDWQQLADHESWLPGVPLILAGGLTPDNVAEAIRIVRPSAVDVASGVESEPGKKDVAKVRDFVAAARAAFAAL